MWLAEILNIPWLLPALIATLVVAFVLGGRVGEALHAGPRLGWALVVSLGIVLSATLTPSREAFELEAAGARACDLSRIGLIPVRELLSIGDRSLNVLMFIPLGAVIGLLPRSRRTVAIVVGAFALPFAIEAIQLVVTPLDRACQGADVVDNLTGLAAGLVAGVLVARLARAIDRAVGLGR